MWFKIERTSGGMKEDRPIEGAVLRKFVIKHTWIEGFPAHGLENGELFLTQEDGTRHPAKPIKELGVVDQNAYGENIHGALYEEWHWAINVDALEDVLKLVDEYGEIIINPKEDEAYELEVYDDYRE